MSRTYHLNILLEDVIEVLKHRSPAYAAIYKDGSIVYDYDNKKLSVEFPCDKPASANMAVSEWGLDCFQSALIETLLDAYIQDYGPLADEEPDVRSYTILKGRDGE